jgi:FKBP-type peptidyl-prolyl cis-trans isomerase FklB
MKLFNKQSVVKAYLLVVPGLLIAPYVAADSEIKNISPDISLESDKAKLGYTIGSNISSSLSRSGMLNDIELKALIAALRDAATGKEPRLSQDDMMAAEQKHQEQKQQEALEIANKNKSDAIAHIEKVKAKDGVTATESGLLYEVLRASDGAQPTENDTVKVHYEGKLIDGTTFDSSYARNAPADFPVTKAIKGFTEGLQLMNEGAKYRFTIPSDLAYGQSAPPSIGPNQVLVFEVELLEVIAKPKEVLQKSEG